MLRTISVVLFSVVLAAGCTKEGSITGETTTDEKVAANTAVAAEGSKEHAGKEHAGKEHAGKEHAGKEHAGKEHAGKEHAGKEHAGKEHAGKEHAGEGATSFSAAQIKAAMTTHIASHTTDGIFKIKDNKVGTELSLKFVKIHDPVRKIEGKGYFACTDFSVDGDKEGKLYDLDFWLNPKDGKLVVTNTKIHKHPKKNAGKWVKDARYTFVDDKPVEIN